MKYGTIAEMIGKFNITVRRVIRKLVILGIIEKVQYIRPATSSAPTSEDEVTERLPADEALLSKSLLKSKDLNYTSPTELPKLSAVLFSRMKDLLATTIGDIKLAREL